MSETVHLNPGTTDIDQLSPGEISAVPVPRPDGWLYTEEENWSFHEAYTIERSADDGGDVLMVNQDGSAHRILITITAGDDRAYGRFDYDQYVGDTDQDGDSPRPPMDEGDWDDLFERSPSENGSEGPAMNYWYPLAAVEDDPVNAAAALRDLPLCVVEVDGNWGLALTGGGMDLTWSIAEAYTRLGHLPPVHFTDLPGEAGRTSSTDIYVTLACLRTLTVAQQRAQWALERFADRIAKGHLPGGYQS